MARFGLDSDSDSDDSDAPSHSTDTPRRSRSVSNQPSNGDNSFTSSTPHSDSQDDQEDEHEHEDEAPPRSSLVQHGSDSDYSNSEGDENDRTLDDDQDEDVEGEDEGDSHMMADDTFLHQTQPRSTRSRSHRDGSVSTSFSHSPAPLPPASSVRRLALPPSHSASQQQQQQQPWAAKLKLDPSRVAVMQASFFHQPDSPGATGMGAVGVEAREEERVRRREEEEERERKRRAVEKGFEKRGEKPSPAAAAVPTPILDPAPFRSFRQHERVPLSSSAVSGQEASVIDAGLALGRSFRVGWGPKGEMITLKGVYGGVGEVGKDGSATLKVERIKLLESNDSSAALRLLKLQLSHTEIFPPSSPSPSATSSSAPAAVPSSSLRFSDFVSLFTTPSSSSAASPTTAEEAQLFSLGHVLFDEIADLALPTPSDGENEDTQSASHAAYITALRRRDALSKWFEQATASEVAADLAALPPSSSSTSSSAVAAKRIFAHLSGHQTSQACDAAVSSNNLRLATLLAQSGGSSSHGVDSQVQEDLYLQLAKWREYKVDSLVSSELRRVYEVLCGNLGESEGRNEGEDRSETFQVLKGVGWKRAVGMGLWYASHETVEAAVEAYEASLASSSSSSEVAPPTPSYLLPSSSKPAWAPSRQDSTPPNDPAFHLLKLSTSPTHALSSELSPRNFGASPADYRLPFHLYVLLSRVLRRRDFDDREEVEVEVEGGEEGSEGNSSTADRVTVSYAMQLEMMGLWEWSAFVLLHLELDLHRATAIRALLARQVEHLQDEQSEQVRFVVETLKIPMVWVYSVLATHSLSLSPPPLFRSYTLLLSSLRTSEAHRLAVEELVPEAIVRGDKGLVRRLLEPFVVDEEEEREDTGDEGMDGQGEEGEGERGMRGSVEGWEEGGKVYLLYLLVLSRASTTLTASSALHSTGLLAKTISAVQRFSQRVQSAPRTRGNLKLRLAVAEMVSRLGVLAKASSVGGGRAGSSLLSHLQPSLLPESDRAVWIQGANRNFFEASLGKAGVAV